MTLTIKGSTPTVPVTTYVKGSVQSDGFSSSVVSNPVLSSGASITTPTVHDVITTLNSGAQTLNNQIVPAIKPLISTNANTITYTSDNPTQVAVDSSGNVTQVTPSATASTANITVTLPNYGSHVHAVSVNKSGTNIYTKTGFVTTSLAYHIDTAIKTMIAGKTPEVGNDVAMWNTNTFSAGTRNTSMFAYPYLDLSAIGMSSTTDSVSNIQRKPYLISPYHIIGANHYRAGGDVYFMSKNDSTIFHGTLSGSVLVAGCDDTLVQGINWITAAPTSADITFFKVLPSNWANYLPTLNTGTVLNSTGTVPIVQIPALFKSGWNLADSAPTDEMKVTTVSLLVNGNQGSNNTYLSAGYSPIDTAFQPWRSTGGLYGSDFTYGDSGSALIFPVSEGGAGTTAYIPVLLCAVYQGTWIGTSAHYGNITTQIQTAMNTISAGLTVTTQQTLQVANLTAFPNNL